MIDRRSFLNYKIPETWALFHFDETSSSNAEVTGNEDVHLYVNSYITSADQVMFGSRSFYSSGRDGYISIYLPASIFTVEFWIKRTGTAWNNTGSICPLVAISDGDNYSWDGPHTLYFYTNDALGYHYSIGIEEMSSSTWNVVSTGSQSNGYYWYNVSDWTHIAVTYDYSVLSLYMNGNLIMYTNSGYFFNHSHWEVGSTTNGKFPYFHFGNYSYGMYAYMDELRVSSKVLYTGSSFTVPSSAFTI